MVRRIEPEPAGRDELRDEAPDFPSGPWITVKRGVNRFVWDLRYAGSTKVLGNKLGFEANVGPLVVPGTYQVNLLTTEDSGDTTTLTEEFEVANDPRADVTQEDLENQLAALLDIRDHISRAHEAVTTIRSIKKQLAHWRDRDDLGAAARDASVSLEDKVHSIEDKLMVPGTHTDTFGGNDPARLSEKLASVISIIASADAKPTRNSLVVAKKYQDEIDEQLEELERVLGSDLASFNELMTKADLPAIQV